MKVSHKKYKESPQKERQLQSQRTLEFEPKKKERGDGDHMKRR